MGGRARVVVLKCRTSACAIRCTLGTNLRADAGCVRALLPPHTHPPRPTPPHAPFTPHLPRPTTRTPILVEQALKWSSLTSEWRSKRRRASCRREMPRSVQSPLYSNVPVTLRRPRSLLFPNAEVGAVALILARTCNPPSSPISTIS